MRNQWYGDNRDVVKWSVVYRLAGARATRIVYLPMLRPDTPPLDALTLSDGAALPEPVLAHFRDAGRASEIARGGGHPFAAVEGAFDDREAYMRRALRLLGKAVADKRRRVLIVVDPDTGIAPRSGGDKRHVLPTDLRALYDALRPTDVLALYQHARRTKSWLKKTRAEVGKALGLKATVVRHFTCSALARDVAMLVVEKNQ